MASLPGAPPQKRRSGDLDNHDLTVNEEELKGMIKRTMGLARGVPPTDYEHIISKIDREPEVTPKPPKKPQAKEDKKKKMPGAKKKQSIKKMSIKPKH